MLDTGIDVPEIVNLVFFKLVRSKTKFWQMLGRGTRLRPDLFGPKRDKKFFYIFDFCQNLEFFSQNPQTTDGASGDSLTKKLFVSRVELIATIDKPNHSWKDGKADEKDLQLRSELAEHLHREVAAMTLNNFLVRAHRRSVEQFSDLNAWSTLSAEDQQELITNLAGLPTSLPSENIEAKQFDLLLLRMQITLLCAEAGFNTMRENVETIARLLEEQTAIPAVLTKLPLIQEVQSQPFWDDINVVELERLRKGLRDLVQFIERRKRETITTDFLDTIGEGVFVELPGISVGVDAEKIRDKALVFLRKYENDPVLHKLRFNQPLTNDDLAALEAIFTAEGTTPAEIDTAKKEGHGLGLFVRSLVGLDRAAAKAALNSFLEGKNLTPNQIEFTNLLINYLAQRGWIELAWLYDSPFTDGHPHGVDGLFDETATLALISALNAVRQNAIAAHA